MGKRPTNAKIIQALESNGAIMVDTAKALNTSRVSLWAWIRDDEELQEAKKSVEESMIDLAESKLMTRIKGYSYTETTSERNEKGKMVETKKVVKSMAPDVGAIAFYLKTKAKNRGYIEKQEFDVGDLTMTITVE